MDPTPVETSTKVLNRMICTLEDIYFHFIIFIERSLGPSVLPWQQLCLHHNVRHMVLYNPAKFN